MHDTKKIRFSGVGLVAVSSLVLSACAVTTESQLKPIDKVLTGVPDPAMKERWRNADAAGALPPINAVPAAKQPVALRRPVWVQVAAAEPSRPVIAAQAIVAAQPFSRVPVTQYDGAFQITSHRPGVLIGTLKDRTEPLELYYRLPRQKQLLDIKEKIVLNLKLRDEVVDTALQRRVILHTAQGTTPFVFIAEGSQQPYRQTIEELKLTVEQLPADEAPKEVAQHPFVKLTYGDASLTLKPGERGKLGEGERALEAYLLESLAIEPQLTLLREGQPYYVNVILYRAR
jgi:hypothetical protein